MKNITLFKKFKSHFFSIPSKKRVKEKLSENFGILCVQYVELFRSNVNGLFRLDLPRIETKRNKIKKTVANLEIEECILSVCDALFYIFIFLSLLSIHVIVYTLSIELKKVIFYGLVILYAPHISYENSVIFAFPHLI